MEIEYQGIPQEQPTYQHVGYTAAAFESSDVYVNAEYRRDATAWSGLAIVGLVATLMVARHWRRLRLPVALLGMLAGITVLVGGVVAGISAPKPEGTMTPQFHRTLYELERLCAITDDWVREHGRAPTEKEWLELFAETPKDGWGHTFEYATVEDAHRDGRRYLITSTAESRGKTDDFLWDIPSMWLGRDGRFGTEDDWQRLKHGLEGVKLEQYPHYPQPLVKTSDGGERGSE